MQTLATIPLVLAVAEEELQLLPDFPELLWGAVAFALLMAFLSAFVFPKLQGTLDERSAKIQGQIEEAEAVRAEAEQLRKQYEAQLADARSEANKVIEEAREQADRLRQDMLSRAEEDAQQVLDRAREQADADRGRLVQELRTQVAALSVELAGKIVQRELDEAQHRELVDSYINELSGLN